jgi:hypothetical protein
MPPSRPEVLLRRLYDMASWVEHEVTKLGVSGPDGSVTKALEALDYALLDARQYLGPAPDATASAAMTYEVLPTGHIRLEVVRTPGVTEVGH